MNLRKTISGAAVALGSTAVMLGLGGTAHATGVDLQSDPTLDTELGKVGGVGKLANVDTDDPNGKFQLVNQQRPDITAVITDLDAQQVGSMLGYGKQDPTSHIDTGLGI
ncbi:hypothetical protein GCM10010492_23130 [Saccharothrix mutabilis subsp. mutabilis]|uniref:Secreted protein n=1 Tax=Saccharothrix mutabilis subsp. mutabilis TaxID=66855 RepID=A0ABN0TKY9_9PSEU